MEDKNIFIVGAGISGLIAAFELEKAGFSPTILEAANWVGGRVRTEEKDGYLLDRGFQVLLTAYPEAKRYLDYEALNLKTFEPGAVILKPGNTIAFYDPLRNPSKIIDMAISPVGTFMDKLKIFNLTRVLKSKSAEQIFSEPSTTTMEFLTAYGFSKKIIDHFFKPFFKGIFLENELETSSRMFKFVFKMFAEGNAAVPENGMGAIAEQLMNNLKKTVIRLNKKVAKIEGLQIFLEDGEKIIADKIIIATQPDAILPDLAGKYKRRRNVVNLYFTLEKSFMANPIIGLVPDERFLINNLVFMTDISKSYSKNGRALLSVSITETVVVDDALPKKVAIELEALTGIKAEYFQFLKSFDIKEALPDLDEVRYTMAPFYSQLYDDCFLAGDYLLNGSINAAMTSGRNAAKALLLSLQTIK